MHLNCEDQMVVHEWFLGGGVYPCYRDPMVIDNVVLVYQVAACCAWVFPSNGGAGEVVKHELVAVVPGCHDGESILGGGNILGGLAGHLADRCTLSHALSQVVQSDEVG